ncbi:hypothetical protein [Campylobacter corcagiensis]|uniref:Uncharacterized protein n=1 Tax=Campylobacter corcagiensis TaxID=1448857 RepID=A0A7M1LDP1_9BACT|nr:hypothetical protein [Campylobacter corcagiensis]QKF65165.1 hypothetical protein CCORG_1322 [Campylobacter corcagiensis]QOQ86692.1 hypothetical protein IMC76_05545 [Campylobacter corcagiensis]
MKELEVYITSRSLSRSYKITVEDDFAQILKEELQGIVDHNNNLDAKDLLGAFVKKSYEKYLQTKGINEILLEIEEIK